jgi:anti-sigma factor RsiW
MADSRVHVTCQEVVELITDYLEGALSPERAELFEQHVNFCDGCEWYLDQMRATIAAVGRIDEADMPDELRDRLLTAFRDRDRA